ncbi:MAG TPA: ParB/RepB/Spo0J family partition protein [Candidatus Binatia bacterium]|nr:ParB/RepB/Spo0J family partition protein [Candidatus Binatia bacterium]
MIDAPKRKSLGRGFGALIPQAPPPKAAERTVPLEQITPNPWQPRVHFDEARIREMAESIREHGIIEPLVVRPRAGGYELIAGERRLRAARLAGLESVPVAIREMSDRDVLEVTLIENLQREDLSPLEEAAAYVRLMEEFGATQDDVARRVGRSRPAVANTIRLLQLPEAVREELRAGRLSAGHARALLAIDSPVEQTALARDAIRLGLSVRQLEARIRLRLQPSTRKRASRDLHVADVEKQLMRSLGTRVRLQGRGSRGRIVIEFYSPAELQRLVERLRHA